MKNTNNELIKSEVESVTGRDMNNSNIYLSECDSNGVPLLKRIEKYPDLPEDEFIFLNILDIKKDTYRINKRGEIINNKTGKLLNSINRYGYISQTLISNSGKKLHFRVHRLVAFIFLENPNLDIYSIVNHIDHNPENNNLFNLEWVTPHDNMNKKSGKCSLTSEDNLVQYIALDNNEEIFRLTRRDKKSIIYDPDSIISAIKDNRKYKGYFWKVENKKEKIILGFSGNLDDYEWYEHWKYPGLYVCKEGFIKYKDKLLYSLTSDGYVGSSIRINNKRIYFRVHRVIAEFILKRDLEKDEVVDHINTVRHDNSFSNLRVTDMKGNMNNQKTLEKLIKCFVVSDLCGDFLNYTSSKEFYRIFLKKEVNKSKRDSILLVNIVNQKYICIEAGDKDALYKKMENVIYIFNKSKTKILGAYSSIYSTGNNLHNDNKTILKYINTDHDINGMYYMRGPEAVKLVLLLGHGTAGDYKPEE
jgi:hypothetical protein